MNITIQNKSQPDTPVTFQLQVQASDDVQSVKELIYAEKNILPDEQRFIFDGKHLEDGRTLQSYGIRDGSTIYLLCG